MMRRLLNIGVAIIGLIAAAPIILVLAILIRVETSGSPFFMQRRVGRDECVFNCYKLRTMYADTKDAASHLVGKAQVTRMGALLRPTKLDELPQFWNVLIGDMDIVGPRPCLPSQTELIDARRSSGVFAVRPGITGLAQVMGVDMSDPMRLTRIDGDYVGNPSLRQDLAICIATFGGSGFEDRTQA